MALNADEAPTGAETPAEPQQTAPQEADRYGRQPGLTAGAAVLANLLVLALPGISWLVLRLNADLHYRLVQEDALVEWVTFWTFLAAAIVFVRAAWRARQDDRLSRLFVALVGLFCFVFAMEEVSWFQRQFGYLPPDLFLQHNYQQELNVHNILGRSTRKWTLIVLVVAYGVALPALLWAVSTRRSVARWLAPLGRGAPPRALMIAFAAMAVFYWHYPWRFTGEWAELMLGLSFLFTGLAATPRAASSGIVADSPTGATTRLVLGATLLVCGLGLATSLLARHPPADHTARIAAAETELAALKLDFESDQIESACNRHRRLFTFMQRYEQPYLLNGAFADLQENGLPPERAAFLLDPWNYAYWVRDICRDGVRTSFIYSFGPNRQRDSNAFEIRGDDIGVYLDLR